MDQETIINIGFALLLWGAVVIADGGHSPLEQNRAGANPSFEVISGPMKPDNGLSAADEVTLVRHMVEDTFPVMPNRLKQIATQITFVVDHQTRPTTEFAFGWSAEDDANYHYPDTGFYNAKLNPSGSIRVNISERFLQLLDLGLKVAKSNPEALEGLREFYRAFLIHELTHSWQYHTHPVKDFSRFPKALVDGIADEAVLKDAKQKVEYERDAFATERPFETRNHLLALADALATYLKANPELFSKTGPYSLLGPNSPAGVSIDKRVRNEAETLKSGRDFPDTVAKMYYGEVVPVESVLKLKKLNDQLAQTQGGADARTKASSEVAAIRKTWGEYMTGKLKEKLLQQSPYLKEVESRFNRELVRFQTLNNASQP